MNVLNNLDDFQTGIIIRIIENFNNYTEGFHDSTSIDEANMFLSHLMYDILNTNIYVEEMYIATFKDSSQITFQIVYNTHKMRKNGIEDMGEYIEKSSKSIKLELIRFLDFIYKLYNHGLIVFSDEEEGETDYSVWEKADYKLCQTKGFIVESVFFSSEVFKYFVDKYYTAAIIPSSLLIEYRNNGFQNEGQIQFKRTQLVSKIAIGISLIIGLGSPWLMTKCSKSTIEPVQLEYIINAIPERVDEVRLNQEQMDSITSAIKNISKNNGKTTNEKPGLSGGQCGEDSRIVSSVCH